MEVDINEYAEGAILLDGLESAIVGITDEFGTGKRVLYSKDKILKILQERDGMTFADAEEYFDYNIIGGYFGEQNPIFLDFSIHTMSINENSYIYKLV
jgi:hypothetical protein